MLIQNINNLAQEPPTRPVTESTGTQGTQRARVEQDRSSATPSTGVGPSKAQLKDATESVNEVLRQNSNSLQFSVDDETNITVVKLVDTETGDVIRQIPSKEMIAIAQSISQVRQGLLLKQEA